MIKSVFCLLFALCVFTGEALSADSTGTGTTKLEAAIAYNDAVLHYDYYDSGTLGGSFDVKFTTIAVADPAKTQLVAKGLRVTIIGEKDATSTVYLDSEDLLKLFDAIEYIKGVSVKFADAKREPYTEVVFSTKGGFKFGYFNKGIDSGLFGSNTGLFIKTPTMTSMLKDDEKRFSQLRSIIDSSIKRVAYR